jgi:hypothetical protein
MSGKDTSRLACTRRFGTVTRDVAALPLLLLLGHGALSAQTVSGRVTDAASAAAVADADVVLRTAQGATVATRRTDAEGRFTIAAQTAGEYQLGVLHVAFLELPPLAVRLGASEIVLVDIRLSASAIPLDPITVTGRRHDARHDASLAGMLARRELYPPHGSRRVLLHGDPELATATRVADVLHRLPQSLAGGGCRIFYWNGNLVRTPTEALMLSETPPQHISAIEYYRTWHDAPHAYRDAPMSIRSPTFCSVVALWTGADLGQPGPPRRGLLGYALVAAAAALTFILAR